MKKSVLLMSGLLAMALAGSAQAATMFAVQDATGTIDKTAISDAGDIATAGKISVALDKVPIGTIGTALAGPAGVFHLASESNALASAGLIMQHVALPGQYTPAVAWSGSVAPNFSMYRINKNDQDGTYSLPAANNSLGYFNFGTIDRSKDANAPSSRKNLAQFFVKAEGTWVNAIDTPTYFSWANAATGVVATEKMRLSSVGNLGIGTTAPVSKLHVVGLPVFADNAAATTGGLTAGAFYRTSTGVLMVTF